MEHPAVAFRSKGHSRATLVIGAVTLLIYVGGIASVSSMTDSSRGNGAAVALAFLALGSVHVALILRSALSGVLLDSEGVRVRNPFRTYRLSWDDIDAFYLGPSGRHACVALVALANGRSIPILGIRGDVGFLRDRPEAAEALIARLTQAAHDARRAGGAGVRASSR